MSLKIDDTPAYALLGVLAVGYLAYLLSRRDSQTSKQIQMGVKEKTHRSP